MTNQRSTREQLEELAHKLRSRREQILLAWHAAVKSDPVLTTGPSLPRRQFLDHIPGMLDAFENVLRSWGGAGVGVAADQENMRAAQHGLARWRQGYQLFEVIREWRHLQLALVVELESLAEPFDAPAMAIARRLLAELCADGVCESAERYFTLQRAEAQSRLEELEVALRNYEEIERQRADAWREAAHDLRGNLGVVKTATAVLNTTGVPDSARTKSLNILHRGVESMHELLNELITLARLEAGREVRQLESFDVARMLAELCQNMGQVADSRGLELKYVGPTLLMVQCDHMKVRRIAQNLLINALTYTHQGFVTLECAPIGTSRWSVRVSDSGPGFPASSTGLLAGFGPATTDGESPGPAPVQAAELMDPSTAPAGSVATRVALGDDTAVPRGGEGIGLSIVKRLCELLDATIELRTSPEAGSSFLVSFPKDYDT